MTSPANLANPFRRALTAIDTIRDSAAYREGWLDEIDLHAALWDLAQHLQTGTQLRNELESAPAEVENREQVDEARTALGACLMHMREGADRLAGLAHRISVFDRELAAPARRAELEKVRAVRAQKDAEQVGRLAAVAAKFEAIEPALGEVADRATGVLDAYDELQENHP